MQQQQDLISKDVISIEEEFSNDKYMETQKRLRKSYFDNKEAFDDVYRLNIYKFTLSHTTRMERVFRFFIFLIWAILTWIVFISKVESNGFADFLEHLTNWAWIFHVIYFTFDIISYFDTSGALAYYLHSQALWFVNGVSWLVFWLVFFVLGDNPDLLLEMSKREGGKYELGAVFIGDRMFHVVPAIILVAYFILRRNEIGLAVVDSMNPYRYAYISRFISALGILVILPGFVVLAYRLFSDIQKVYGVNTGDGILLIVGIVVIFIHNVVPYKLYYNNYLYTARPKRIIVN